MDREFDLSKLGFANGDKVILVDDDWSQMSSDVVVVEAEPVPGSTQCVIKDSRGLRTVSRSALRLAA